jgi:hypothetical protein
MSRLVRALMLAGLVAWPNRAGAVSFVLGDGDRAEAIRVGQRSVTQETLGTEWTLTTGTGELTVVTPFHRLALAARRAAFNQTTLTPRDIENVLREDRGRLVFWATLHGGRVNFARFYAPALVVGGREVQPTFVQNERTALRQADGTYVARCAYGFATDALDPRARVVLVVRDPDGREVARFPVDLAAMR